MNGQQRPRPATQVLAAPSGLGFDAAGFESFDSAGFEAGFASSAFFAPPSSFASAFGASSLPARLRFLSPSFLKSVSYQPLPARRNAGAVRRRFTRGLPQVGQSVGSGSESFCRRSKRSPHSVHSNS